jgi:Sel1 repeat
LPLAAISDSIESEARVSPATVVARRKTESNGVAVSGGLSRVWRGAFVAAVTLGLSFGLTSCASSSYAGISLASGAADPELQALARRARSGDKTAQLDLGVRYEEGRGVRPDPARALRLYRRAANDAPLSSIYSIPSNSGGAANTGILYSGASSGGLPYALARYCSLAGFRPADRERDGCPAAGTLDDLALLVSYDLNYSPCASRNQFRLGEQTRYAEVRACVIEARRTLACGSPLAESLEKVASLAAANPAVSGLGPAVAATRRQCRIQQQPARPLARGRRPGDPLYLTPLDAILERQVGEIRGSGDLFAASTLWSLVCRPSAAREGIVRTSIEEAMCAITRRPGAEL